MKKEIKNLIIGDPIEVISDYLKRESYRSLSEMSNEECKMILTFAIDDGEWRGPAINGMQIAYRYGSFVEGNITLGEGETYYFTISYDGSVEIHKMEFDEAKMEFKHTSKRRRIYRFSDIVYYMMLRGFDLTSHLYNPLSAL